MFGTYFRTLFCYVFRGGMRGEESVSDSWRWLAERARLRSLTSILPGSDVAPLFSVARRPVHMHGADLGCHGVSNSVIEIFQMTCVSLNSLPYKVHISDKWFYTNVFIFVIRQVKARKANVTFN